MQWSMALNQACGRSQIWYSYDPFRDSFADRHLGANVGAITVTFNNVRCNELIAWFCFLTEDGGTRASAGIQYTDVCFPHKVRT